MRRGFLLLWGLMTLIIATVVGGLAYWAGVASHVATVAAPNGGPDYYFYPHFFGFGFIFPLLFILLILFIVFRPRRRHGGWGPGRGGHLEQRLEEWHKRAHGESTDTSR
jgi:hypothetical protein